jgi:hypothetical protein
MVEEKTRRTDQDSPGDGLSEDTETDGAGTGGMVRHEDAGGPIEPSGGGLASSLQPGGTNPGGGPGAMIGSIGSGGGSDEDEPTGDAGRNDIDEEIE